MTITAPPPNPDTCAQSVSKPRESPGGTRAPKTAREAASGPAGRYAARILSQHLAGHLPRQTADRLIRLLMAELSPYLRLPTGPSTPLDRPLTERQTQVLHLAAQGLTTRAIAAQLWITTDTAKTHMLHACKALGATTRAQAVAVAYERGILPAAGGAR